MTSELSVSTPTSERLRPRTRGDGASRRNKGRNVFEARTIIKTRIVVVQGSLCLVTTVGSELLTAVMQYFEHYTSDRRH